MKISVLALAVLTFAAGTAFAQIPVGTRVADVTTTYDSGGRRDPFLSLIQPKRPAPGQISGRLSTGLNTFAVNDVTVTGIVRKGNTMMAILQGPDRQSFVAHVKDRLMDATVKSIDAQGVVFVELAALGTPARPQEYRKLLRSAAEVNR